MEELKRKIVELCNESGLPLEPIMFVVKDVYRDVETTYRNLIKEKQEEKSE